MTADRLTSRILQELAFNKSLRQGSTFAVLLFLLGRVKEDWTTMRTRQIANTLIMTEGTVSNATNLLHSHGYIDKMVSYKDGAPVTKFRLGPVFKMEAA